jgi:hypothetical protein
MRIKQTMFSANSQEESLNSKRILLIASVLLTIISIVYNLMPAPVQAATTINLNPAAGISGSISAITGDGFIGKLATIYWDEKRLVQNIPVSKTGQIDYTFEIPSAAKGEHTVRVTDDSNWANINATFTFSVKPSVTVEPPWGKSVATMTIAGDGFAAGETGIKATWDGKSITKVPIIADRNGTWYTSFQVPYVAKGEYTISAQGDGTGLDEVTGVVFTVAPFCKATPTSGPVGTKILVTGVGFRAGEDGMTFTWDGPILDANYVAQANGSFAVTLVAPPSTKGRHILGTYGSSFTPRGIVPDIEFEILPSIALTPSDLVNSRDLKVDGTGFNAGESIAISYDKSNVGTSATTDAKGNFSITFQTPTIPGKDHQVTATGSKGAVAQATYTSLATAPAAPQLLYPGPGARIQTANSVFDVIAGMFKSLGGAFQSGKGSEQKLGDATVTTMNWSSAPDQSAFKYTLQISRTADFSSVIFTKDGIQSTAYNLTKSNLPLAGAYFWRVKASNDTGAGPWSNSWSFEILPTSPLILTISVTIILLLLAIIIFGIIALVNRRRFGG